MLHCLLNPCLMHVKIDVFRERSEVCEEPPTPTYKANYKQQAGKYMTKNASRKGKSTLVCILFIFLPCMWGWVAIPCSWYKAQKTLKPGKTKNKKKIRKYTKFPTPGRAPKTRKRYENGPKMTAFVFFLFFFFSVLWGPDLGRGISYLFRISGLEGVLSSVPGTRNCKGWGSKTIPQKSETPNDDKNEV